MYMEVVNKNFPQLVEYLNLIDLYENFVNIYFLDVKVFNIIHL